MKEHKEPQFGTPYDDVFRTILNDCSFLILPVLNEIFHTEYTGEETILFRQNEHFLNQQDGKEKKRITDNAFKVIVKQCENPVISKEYHVECQSTEDSGMLVRFFEYDSQIALDGGTVEGNRLKVKFPHSAALYLRSGKNTPENLMICLETPGGTLEYPIPVMKCQSYTLEEIFDKRLLFLLPFYIFTYEGRFEEYEKNADKLAELQQEYAKIVDRLEGLCIKKEINEYTKLMLIDMSKKVLEHIAAKKKNIREGVKKVMGGKILEYEAKTILNSGIEQGLEQGLEQGKIQTLIQLICRKRKRGTSAVLIAKDLEIEIQTVEEICTLADPFAPDYDCEMIWQAYLELHK